MSDDRKNKDSWDPDDEDAGTWEARVPLWIDIVAWIGIAGVFYALAMLFNMAVGG